MMVGPLATPYERELAEGGGRTKRRLPAAHLNCYLAEESLKVSGWVGRVHDSEPAHKKRVRLPVHGMTSR